MQPSVDRCFFGPSGAQSAGGELVLFEDCDEAAKGGAVTVGFEMRGGTIRNGDMCVTADTNGTHEGHGGGKQQGDNAFLFNVRQSPLSRACIQSS